MKAVSNRSIIFTILSLLLFLFLLFYFVVPGTVIQSKGYQGPGTPFIHTP